jgi:hypothetical protein
MALFTLRHTTIITARHHAYLRDLCPDDAGIDGGGIRWGGVSQKRKSSRISISVEFRAVLVMGLVDLGE